MVPIILQIIVVGVCLYLGMRVGGIGVGFAGGIGVAILSLLGCTPAEMPLLVMIFILVVIVSVAAMQAAGGVDYLVYLTNKALRKYPRLIIITAPLATFTLTFMASTGQVSFACMPIIVDVAREHNIKPTRTLAIAVAGSLLGIVASPISAAVIFLSGVLEKQFGQIGYIDLISISIPSTFIAVLLTSIIFYFYDNLTKKDILDPKLVGMNFHEGNEEKYKKPERKGAALSVLIFLVGLILVLVYAILIDPRFGLITDPRLSSGQARISLMLGVGLLIIMLCKVKSYDIPKTSIFRTGMSSITCILGVAWLGSTFLDSHIEAFKHLASLYLLDLPISLPVIVALLSCFLYSQAASTKILLPLALSMGFDPATVIASFAATSALFILPNYPTLLAAVELDTTHCTRLGHHIIDHPFMIPGLLTVIFSVIFGFLLGEAILPSI